MLDMNDNVIPISPLEKWTPAYTTPDGATRFLVSSRGRIKCAGGEFVLNVIDAVEFLSNVSKNMEDVLQEIYET